MNEGIMKKDEIVANFVIIAFFVFMLYDSFKLHKIQRFGDVGSGFWPILALSAAIILSIALLISNLKKYQGRKKQPSGEASTSPAAEIDLKNRRKKFVLSAICLLGYILIMPYIGFILATIVYVFAFILALEERRNLVLALSPFLLTALIVIVFAKFIGMPLPRGVDFFAAFSRFIY